jgi:hypothetical protein
MIKLPGAVILDTADTAMLLLLLERLANNRQEMYLTAHQAGAGQLLTTLQETVKNGEKLARFLDMAE